MGTHLCELTCGPSQPRCPRGLFPIFPQVFSVFESWTQTLLPVLETSPPVRQQCFQNSPLHLNGAPGSFLWSVSSKFAKEGENTFCSVAFTIALDKRAASWYVCQLDQLQLRSYKTRKDRYISGILLSTTVVLVNRQLKAPCPEDNSHGLLLITS